MKAIKRKDATRLRRRRHVRKHMTGTGTRPRLTVARTLKHISVQLVDDEQGRTLAAATSTAKALGEQLQGKTKTERAAVIGAEIARKAKDQGIEAVIFDRGHSKYHGRVKALAEAAREAGLKF